MAENNSELRTTAADDEINILEYAYELVKYKWIIFFAVVLGFFVGYMMALREGPSYVADALIAPKESEKVNMPNLSGLGMLGGMVTSQISMGGNASMDKVDRLLESRTFNKQFVKVCKIDSILGPVLYSSAWDSSRKCWKEDSLKPNPIGVGGYVSAKMLTKELNKKGLLSLKIASKDSATSYEILKRYITFTDKYIRETTRKDAQDNREYLEKQLISVSDPLLRAKLQELIANEVEKQMIVSKEAFKVVDSVLVGEMFQEKKRYPLIGAFLFSVLVAVMVVLLHAFKSAGKDGESKFYLEKIKKDLLSPPFFLKRKNR